MEREVMIMERKLTKEEIKQREEDFQVLQHEYFTKNSKSAWDKMWFLVYDACLFSAKKQLKVKTDDLEGKVMNATCDVMTKIKNGEVVQKLSNFVYWYVKGRLYDKKLQKNEQCLSYDWYISSIEEKENSYNY